MTAANPTHALLDSGWVRRLSRRAPWPGAFCLRVTLPPGSRSLICLAVLLVSLAVSSSTSADTAVGQTPIPTVPAPIPVVPDSACAGQTPTDGPYGCLEIFPLGSSAFVTLDDVSLGLSPAVMGQLAPGSHAVRLDREGWYPWQSTIQVEAGQSLRIDPPLRLLPLIYTTPNIGAAWPLAVMVENHPDARPQTGLDKADVVYDALAEGGISRFLALYITQEAGVIGPVRSTRHYFVYLAAEFNGTLVHVGASPIGYAALSATGIRHINESAGDAGVWRSALRYPPHNAYTSTLDARAAADSGDPGGAGTWGPLVFKTTESVTPGPSVTSIRLSYPPAGWYDVAYQYDPDTNSYTRWMDGAPHLDGATGEQLRARNLVVQIVNDAVIDQEGRLDLAQTGGGSALFFVDGTMIPGTWTKADFGSRTLYWDSAGNLVRLNATGTTWVQLISQEGTVRYS